MVAIVILNYNTWKATVQCVQSIIKTCFLSYKIYIIDNNSSNNSYQNLYELYFNNPNIIVIKSKVNGGYSKGNNIGIRLALNEGFKYIIIANNDIIFCDNCIQELFDFINNKPKAMIVGPKIYKITGEIQHSSVMKENTFLEYLGVRRKADFYELDEEKITEAAEVYSVSGSCFIMRSKEFVKAGAFDERVFLYNEESILSYQVSRSGFNIYFLPYAKVIHYHGVTTGKQNLFISGEFLKSGLYYWRKYRRINSLQLVAMWLSFTIRTLIKAFYCKEIRSGRVNYLKETWKTLLEVIKND